MGDKTKETADKDSDKRSPCFFLEERFAEQRGETANTEGNNIIQEESDDDSVGVRSPGGDAIPEEVEDGEENRNDCTPDRSAEKSDQAERN